ncbi:MAG: hypothetical protein K0R73_218 [Candidatus Midichloriaceae bacterium]|jgi:uncharacterized protein YggU (UPF0235/DUF167 family)|nr:hypothetical protein [Candidatus Midichloriaceae bacterium]
MFTIFAKVTPKSKTPQIEVLEAKDNKISLKVKVRAAPENGKANDEVIDRLADYFSIPKSKIGLKSGHSSRNKVFVTEYIDITKISMQLPLC